MKFFQDINAPALSGAVGNKAKGLRLLASRGCEIPPTFVLSAETVKKIFSPAPSKMRGPGVPTLSREFCRELEGIFPPGAPLIVRSSAADEDGAGASFAGIYESVVVRRRNLLAGAMKKCLASGRGERAGAYRRLTGKKLRAAPAMALLFEPFLEAEFGGTARLEQGERIVLELARGGSAPVTGGSAPDFRYILDIRGRKLDCPPGGPFSRAAVTAMFSQIAALQKKLFPGRGAAAEFLVRGGRLVFLQARPIAEKGGQEPVDMAAIYQKIAKTMGGLGLRPGDWSLAEGADLAAFNYLREARGAGERLEHFRIRLGRGALEKIAAKGWLHVKYDGDDDTLFPSRLTGKANELFGRLAKDGIFVMFVVPEEGEDLLRKTLAFSRGGERFSLAFSYSFEGIEREEEKALAKIPPGEAAAYLGRLEREREIWLRIRAKLRAGSPGAYEKKLSVSIAGELALLEKKEKLAGRAAAVPARGKKEIKGTPFKPRRAVIAGTAVTYKKVASTRKKRFIYFGYDLEPCFIPYLDRIAAVVVSRGAFGSHAAQICGELGIPLILDTRGLGLVKDGDKVSLDLKTGAVSRI